MASKTQEALDALEAEVRFDARMAAANGRTKPEIAARLRRKYGWGRDGLGDYAEEIHDAQRWARLRALP